MFGCKGVWRCGCPRQVDVVSHSREVTWVLFWAGLWILQGGGVPRGRTIFKVRYAGNVSSSWSTLGRKRDVYWFPGSTLFPVTNPTGLLIDICATNSKHINCEVQTRPDLGYTQPWHP